MSEPVLSARDLHLTFGSKGLLGGGQYVQALKGVNVDVFPGEVVAIIGESGSGKTTLGKAITRLVKLDSGTVHFDGEDLLSLWGPSLLRVRRKIQMVFQNQSANLHPRMSVSQMLDESLRLHRPGLDRSERGALATELLARVNMSQSGRQRPSSLSGGEKRRIGLARILATEPKLVVADEPTSGLDAAIKLEIIDLLKALKADDMSYVLISHDLGLVQRIADRVLVMLNGEVVEELDIGDLKRGVLRHDYTKALLAAAELSDE